MRTVPGQTRDRIMAETRQLLDKVAASTGSPVRTEVEILSFPPVVTPRDHPLVQAVVTVVTAARGGAPAVLGVSYGTDAMALAPAYGVPMVLFGPGHFDQAHQTDEYVEVSELIAAAHVYACLAEQWLA